MQLEIYFNSHPNFGTVSFDRCHETSNKSFTYNVTRFNDGTLKQINTETKIWRDVRRVEIEDGSWSDVSEQINSQCTKHVCRPSLNGADTLENKHFNIASKQFEQFGSNLKLFEAM